MHYHFEEFIKQLRYIDLQAFYELDWNCISRYKYLSEQFIEEFSNYVNWIIIFENQRLSEIFKIKYISKVNNSLDVPGSLYNPFI